jgi:hypothetical protein
VDPRRVLDVLAQQLHEFALDDHVVARGLVGGGGVAVHVDHRALGVRAQPGDDGHEVRVRRKDHELLDVWVVGQCIEDVHDHVDVGRILTGARHRRTLDHREGVARKVLAKALDGEWRGIAPPDQERALLGLVLGEARRLDRIGQPIEPDLRQRGEGARRVLLDLPDRDEHVVEVDEEGGVQAAHMRSPGSTKASHRLGLPSGDRVLDHRRFQRPIRKASVCKAIPNAQPCAWPWRRRDRGGSIPVTCVPSAPSDGRAPRDGRSSRRRASGRGPRAHPRCGGASTRR